MKNFRDLLVGQKAHRLTLADYKVRGGFPTQETYVSVGRLPSLPIWRKAGDSAATRNSGVTLDIAAGSTSELEYHFLLGQSPLDGPSATPRG